MTLTSYLGFTDREKDVHLLYLKKQHLSQITNNRRAVALA